MAETVNLLIVEFLEQPILWSDNYLLSNSESSPPVVLDSLRGISNQGLCVLTDLITNGQFWICGLTTGFTMCLEWPLGIRSHIICIQMSKLHGTQVNLTITDNIYFLVSYRKTKLTSILYPLIIYLYGPTDLWNYQCTIGNKPGDIPYHTLHWGYGECAVFIQDFFSHCWSLKVLLHYIICIHLFKTELIVCGWMNARDSITRGRLLIRSVYNSHIHTDGTASGALWSSLGCSRTVRHVNCRVTAVTFRSLDNRSTVWATATLANVVRTHLCSCCRNFWDP